MFINEHSFAALVRCNAHNDGNTLNSLTKEDEPAYFANVLQALNYTTPKLIQYNTGFFENWLTYPNRSLCDWMKTATLRYVP